MRDRPVGAGHSADPTRARRGEGAAAEGSAAARASPDSCAVRPRPPRRRAAIPSTRRRLRRPFGARAGLFAPQQSLLSTSSGQARYPRGPSTRRRSAVRSSLADDRAAGGEGPPMATDAAASTASRTGGRFGVIPGPRTARHGRDRTSLGRGPGVPPPPLRPDGDESRADRPLEPARPVAARPRPNRHRPTRVSAAPPSQRPGSCGSVRRLDLPAGAVFLRSNQQHLFVFRSHSIAKTTGGRGWRKIRRTS